MSISSHAFVCLRMVKWRSSSVNSLIVLSFYTLICKTSSAAGSALSYAVSSVLSSASGDELGMSVSQPVRKNVGGTE